MTASAKGSSADTQHKDQLLDKDMGKEFLSSWKSMSVTEDDPMDFNFDPPANTKKKFNFEKLDMGFDLDGDFGKLSSFKVDMPDFDFSSPSKKTKTKESSDNKTSGDSKQKKDLFSFSFDFNELDGFDLDSSLQKKGNETSKETMDSDKVPNQKKKDDFNALKFDSNSLPNGQAASVGNLDVKATASDKKEKHISKVSDNAVIDDSLSTKTAAIESMESSEVESPQSFRTSNSNTDRICLELQSLSTSPDKAPCPMIEEVDEHHLSSRTMSPLPSKTSEIAQTAVEGKTGPDIQEVYRSGSKEDSPGSTDQNSRDNEICTVGSRHVKIKPKISSQLCNVVKDMTGHDQSEMGLDTPVKIVDQTRTKQSDPDTGSTSTALSGKLPQDTCVSQNVQMQDPSTKLLMAPTQRGLKHDDLKGMDKAGEGLICSRVFKRPDQTESQVLQPSPNRLECLPVSKESAGLRLHPTNLRSAKDVKVEVKSRTFSKALCVVSLKVDHANSDSEKNVANINANSSQVDASSPTEKTCKLLISGAESLHKPKVSSLERLKHGKIVSDVTGAKTLWSSAGATKDPSDTKLHGEVNYSVNKEQNVGAPRKKSSEIHHSFLRNKAQVLQLSSLKRKTLDEDPNVSVSSLNPPKRFSMSPSETRNPDELSRGGDEGKFCSQDNKMESTLKNPTHQQINLGELEIPVTENDDNVEKAEAYTKELENICNILRKKQEEAKELLVRAIVNNNNLLMLNHPLYEQKISFTIPNFPSSKDAVFSVYLNLQKHPRGSEIRSQNDFNGCIGGKISIGEWCYLCWRCKTIFGNYTEIRDTLLLGFTFLTAHEYDNSYRL